MLFPPFPSVICFQQFTWAFNSICCTKYLTDALFSNQRQLLLSTYWIFIFKTLQRQKELKHSQLVSAYIITMRRNTWAFEKPAVSLSLHLRLINWKQQNKHVWQDCGDGLELSLHSKQAQINLLFFILCLFSAEILSGSDAKEVKQAQLSCSFIRIYLVHDSQYYQYSINLLVMGFKLRIGCGLVAHNFALNIEME